MSIKRLSEASKLIRNNISTKLCDDLLTGLEHTRNISTDCVLPISDSKIEKESQDLSNKEKLEVVLNDPKFGMFSLFKYHWNRGYLNDALKKSNIVYCTHIFSLYAALPLLVFFSQWFMYIALISNEYNNFDGNLCPNKSRWYHKLLMSGVAIVYFVKSFFIWDNLTKRIKLYKVYPCTDIWVMIDTFQEFVFNILVYGANIWIIFVEEDIQNMILNSIAIEFLMQLDNDFQEFYFQYLPGAAEDIYDNVFVSPEENRRLIKEKSDESRNFRILRRFTYIPFKFLIISLVFFPMLCFFMIFYGPICK